ncbi:hypothetical protein Leryth_026120 [Lithospermum erythrorhizon]|nr:hypothetical protein Leryth_026120 [Lithospermum erythrorhizon]
MNIMRTLVWKVKLYSLLLQLLLNHTNMNEHEWCYKRTKITLVIVYMTHRTLSR